MLKITLLVDAPSGQAVGIKEDFAMYCEKFGDTQVVSIEEIQSEQTKLNQCSK